MITFDFETKSYADLTKVGAWAYSEDPTTEVICCAWGVDNEEVQTWWPGKEMDYANPINTTAGKLNYDAPGMPYDLQKALQDGHVIEAHNVSFERSIWMNIMVPRYGWVLPDDDQWRDTMAVACYYALPAALGKVSSVLGYGPKDPEGARLITKYSKLYLKTAKTEIPDEDFQKFVAYCVDDVEREQSVSDELGDLHSRELPIFQLDQRINLRGIALDIDGIAGAAAIVEQRSEALTKEFRGLTGLNPTQRDKVMEWFAQRGVRLDNMQADYLQDLLDHPPLDGSPVGGVGQGETRRAIEIRLAINKASTKKLDAMVRNCGLDGRARFQTRYHGAGTGRWTGSGFQPLNLNRGFEGMDPEQLVSDIARGDAEWLDIVYGDAMDAVAKASRYWIMAEDGNRIISGDFSSIEAVILACIAGEEWKVDAFRKGVKIYEYMADKIYNLPAGTTTKATHPAERQDGKTGELAFGYQGALGAWLKFDSSGRHTNERIVEICRAWRKEHDATVALWMGLQSAAIKATRSGKLVKYRELGFEVVDEWLTMILPNGKRLWYREPVVRVSPPRGCKPELSEKCMAGTCGHKAGPVLSYMAQKEGQWRRVDTYGGKLTENACQAISREILVLAMLRAEEAGYPIILTVYDEIVCEVPNDHGSLDEFKALMAAPLPDWAEGWPIGVDAWEGQRYRK
jgi:DNA polymerase